MAVLGKRIGLKEIRALNPGEIIWDGAVGGFHARRQQSKTVSYIVVYRNAEGRQRWQTIGRHGSPWTPDMAREAAKRILGHVVDGADPAAEKRAKRSAATVAELCDLYLADVEAGRLLTRRKVAKKASTIATDKGRFERHVKPLLGKMKVAAVTREDVDGFMHAVAEGRTAARTKTGKKRGLANVRGGKGTASRTVGLLGAVFTYAVRHRMRLDNPVRGVVRFADGRRKRRLTDDEYNVLGAALRHAEAASIWPPAVAAARFLALTGWRSGEALALRRDEVDLARRTATLGDTKTGPKHAPALACRMRGATEPHAIRRSCVSPDTRPGPHERLSEIVGAHRDARRAAGGRHSAHVAAFVRKPCRRSRLQRDDYRSAGRSSGALDDQPLCSCGRRRAADGCGRGGGSNCRADGNETPT